MNAQHGRAAIAVLWILQVLNYLALVILDLIETGKFATLNSGDNAVGMAVVLAIPCILAWATMALPKSVTHWPNILFALFFASIKLGALSDVMSVQMSAALYINEAWGLAAALLLVWYAWKLPRATAE